MAAPEAVPVAAPAELAEPPPFVPVAGRKDPVENADGKPIGGETGAGVAAMRALTSP
ncbi:hypothetical protein [Actinomycetospora aeridis]|uniref:Uncharacterized protein n=1 Tax=Actinomycetospora aeridis TaxID=3129231 RepID=A0ABU8N2E7_9PSEU